MERVRHVKVELQFGGDSRHRNGAGGDAVLEGYRGEGLGIALHDEIFLHDSSSEVMAQHTESQTVEGGRRGRRYGAAVRDGVHFARTVLGRAEDVVEHDIAGAHSHGIGGVAAACVKFYGMVLLDQSGILATLARRIEVQVDESDRVLVEQIVAVFRGARLYHGALRQDEAQGDIALLAGDFSASVKVL